MQEAAEQAQAASEGKAGDSEVGDEGNVEQSAADAQPAEKQSQ